MTARLVKRRHPLTARAPPFHHLRSYNPVPDADDTPELIAARAFEIATLKSWVAAFHAERAAAKAFLARDERAL